MDALRSGLAEGAAAARADAVTQLLAQAARDGEVELIARGGSMGAALPDGARLRVRARGRYLAGDVLVFLHGSGQLVAHRMLGRIPGREGWRYVTRGDAAPAADGLVPARQVIGRVAGGEADSRISRVPVADRARAFAGFVRYLAGRMLG